MDLVLPTFIDILLPEDVATISSCTVSFVQHRQASHSKTKVNSTWINAEKNLKTSHKKEKKMQRMRKEIHKESNYKHRYSWKQKYSTPLTFSH